MAVSDWTRSQLEELVAGLTIAVRTSDAEDLVVPAWLADAAAEVSKLTGIERIEARHPEDQAPLAEAWIAALLAPGEVFELSYRTRIDGAWFHERCLLLNLIGHPDVDGMVVLSETLGPAEVDPLDEEGPGKYETARWLAFHTDVYGTVREMEGMCEELLGFDCEAAIGRSALDFVTPASQAHTVQMWLQLVTNPGTTHTGQLHMLGVGGEELWIDVTLFHRTGPDGEPDILTVGRDVTEERARQDALRESYEEIGQLAEEFRLLAEEVPAAVFRCDAAGQVTSHNERWGELPGVDAGITRLRDVFAPGERATVDETVAALLADVDGGRQVLELAAGDGQGVLAMSVRAVGAAGSNRRSLVGSITDITAAVALRARAERDPVTGLFNRRGIEERIGRALDDDAGQVTVAFIDLDGFKAVNDDHGHAAGDEVLAEVGRRLAQLVRSGDDVGRYGGDEYVVAAYGTSAASSEALDQRLRQAFVAPIAFDGGTWVPAASIGQAHGDDDDTVASLIGRADRAMYEVKHHRRAAARAGVGGAVGAATAGR